MGQDIKEVCVAIPLSTLRGWITHLNVTQMVQVPYQEKQLDMAHETIRLMKGRVEDIKRSIKQFEESHGDTT